jgi:agmatine deiminase
MSKTLEGAPRRHGYRMPAEFERHSGCWMIWPERPDNWRFGAKPAQAAFRDVAVAIAASERLTMAVSAAQYSNARRTLPAHVRVVEISSNDAWMRDVGPTFLVNGRGGLRGVDWQFNSWGGLKGGLYSPWDKDDAIAQKVLEIEDADRYRAPFVLEGGAIHVDGQGTCITTEECLLNPNRNPSLTRAQIEDRLRAYLDVETVIWLGRGVYHDETDGHVDNLCCFVRPGVVALTWCDDPRDPQYEISRDAYERLSTARDARGRAFSIHKLVQPGPLYMTAQEAAGIDAVDGAQPRERGSRLAGSYVNFYIANRHVVVPLLDSKHDTAALRKLQSLFPTRKVVGVPAREILLGGGNIHCITQQVPSVQAARSRAAPGTRRRRTAG